MGRKRKGGPKIDGVISGVNMIGRTYGYLLVLSETEPMVTLTNSDGYIHRQRAMICLCVCGKKNTVRASSLRSGGTISCGCKQSERLKARLSTHGMSKSSEYCIWNLMRQRCVNPKTIHYKIYGGRGIKVCRRWSKFETFYKDMGPRPSMRHSLDRWPNKNGNYTPKNCRWATQEQQSNNKRNNVVLEIFGEKFTMKELSRAIGMKYTSVVSRVNRGWSAIEIISIPIKNKKFITK